MMNRKFAFLLFFLFLAPSLWGNPIKLKLVNQPINNREDLQLQIMFTPITSRPPGGIFFLFCRSGEFIMGTRERTVYKERLKGLSQKDLKKHLITIGPLKWEKGKSSHFNFTLKVPPLQKRTLYAVVAFLDPLQNRIIRTVDEVFLLRRSPEKFVFSQYHPPPTRKRNIKGGKRLSPHKNKYLLPKPSPLKKQPILPIQIISITQRATMIAEQKREFYPGKPQISQPRCGTPEMSKRMRARESWPVLLQVLKTWNPKSKPLVFLQNHSLKGKIMRLLSWTLIFLSTAFGLFVLGRLLRKKKPSENGNSDDHWEIL